ncbi:MAG: hypothetical protein IH595_03655 [Bacteroidales bacterium]|nr:hypothetical protein [Bacteroidales bacterium]
MDQEIKVQAPMRLDFAGGLTDVPPFCIDEWGYVVNSTIDKYANVRIARRVDKRIVLESKDYNTKEDYPSIVEAMTTSSLSLLVSAIRLAGIDFGVEISVHTGIPPGSGLAASTAVSIAILKGLYTIKNTEIRLRRLAQSAIHLEMTYLNNLVGSQDQFASSYGGFNSFKITKNGTQRHKLSVRRSIVDQMQRRLILCYSGDTRISGNLVRNIMDRYRKGESKVVKGLQHIREIAVKCEEAVVRGDPSLGKLMYSHWNVHRSLHPDATTDQIEEIFATAMENGSSGGKVIGAGGGGCVLLYCDPDKKQRIQEELENRAYRIISFTFSKLGVHILQPN